MQINSRGRSVYDSIEGLTTEPDEVYGPLLWRLANGNLNVYFRMRESSNNFHAVSNGLVFYLYKCFCSVACNNKNMVGDQVSLPYASLSVQSDPADKPTEAVITFCGFMWAAHYINHA